MHQQVENRVDDDDFGRSLSSCGQPQFVFLAAAETGVAIHATTWRTHLTWKAGVECLPVANNPPSFDFSIESSGI